jgi:hypothetical protein
MMMMVVVVVVVVVVAVVVVVTKAIMWTTYEPHFISISAGGLFALVMLHV